MKRSILILFCIAALSLGGCESWLEVSPGSLIDGDELFESENGFKQALTGAYTRVAASDLYGRNTSMLVPEALAQHWTVGALSSNSSTNQKLIYRLNRFQFDDADLEKRIAEVWASYYEVIAQLNDVLGSLEKNQIVFYNDNDKLIEGEAVGLRAFLHLEILRLFGPVPSADRGTVSIPYVDRMTKEIDALSSISYGSVITKIVADLDRAERILEEYDPIVKYSNDILNERSNAGKKGPAEDWQFLRQSRFNYYAVLGTKARLYQWIGETDKAAEYAKMVIDAVNEDGSGKFRLATTTEIGAKPEYSFRMEHLFGVNNTNLTNNAVNMFLTGVPPTFSNAKVSMDKIFSEATLSDIRYTASGLWVEADYDGVSRMLCLKYTGNTNMSGAVNHNLVPLLRLAEMYLIMIENLPLAEIEPYLSKYYISRGITQTLVEDVLSSETRRAQQLQLEYQKEFFAEGQMFYFYKRKEVKNITNPAAAVMSPENYVVPKPQGQIKFE